MTWLGAKTAPGMEQLNEAAADGGNATRVEV